MVCLPKQKAHELFRRTQSLAQWQIFTSRFTSRLLNLALGKVDKAPKTEIKREVCRCGQGIE